MSDLSQIKILHLTDTYLEVFVEQYNHVEANLNPNLQTSESIRNATLYAFLVDFALNYGFFAPEKYFEIAFYEDADGEKRRHSSNFYDEAEANKIIEKVEILEWHRDTVFTKELFEQTQNPSLQQMFEEAKKSNEIFGLDFDWADFLENIPRNYFTAKVFFKDKKYLVGFEAATSMASTLDTFACEWLG